MRTQRYGARILTAAALALLLASAAVHADDWPQFLGPNRDCISLETGLMKSWPAEGPKLLWEKNIGEGFSCMSVSEGRLFTMCQTGGSQWVLAFDAATGKELWKFETGKEYTNYPGPRVTPAVDGDVLYAADASGRLVCLKVASGEVVWKKDLLSEFNAKNLTWGMASSPLVDGDNLIVNVGESNGNSVVVFNKKNGEVVWKRHNDMAGYSSPTIRTIDGKRQLLFFMGTGAMGMTPENGDILWRIPWKTKYDIHATTPVVKDDLVFIASSYGTGCGLIKIDLDKSPAARLIIKSKDVQSKYTTPILLGEFLYAFDEQQKLRCVNVRTLDTYWTAEGFRNGTLVVADGMAFILGEKGNLALAKLTRTKLDIISQVPQVLTGSKEKRCWTMPVVANGRLYARDEQDLICLDVAAK